RRAPLGLLGRRLPAAGCRPAPAWAAQRDPLSPRGRQHGISATRVRGSVARGTDRHGSDMDLLATSDQSADPLGFAVFVAEATELLGFPVDVVVDDEDVHPLIRRSAVPL